MYLGAFSGPPHEHTIDKNTHPGEPVLAVGLGLQPDPPHA